MGGLQNIPTSAGRESEQDAALGNATAANPAVAVTDPTRDLSVKSAAAQNGLSGASVTAGALTASSGGNTAQIEGDGTVTVNSVERNMASIPGSTQITKAADATLTVDECTNQVIGNYGQSAVETLSLPQAVAGMAFLLIISSTGKAINVKPISGGVIYLDGTALTADHKVQLATPAVGNSASFFCFQQADGSWAWYCNTISGYWADGGV